jgi:hypothetical protein
VGKFVTIENATGTIVRAGITMVEIATAELRRPNHDSGSCHGNSYERINYDNGICRRRTSHNRKYDIRECDGMNPRDASSVAAVGDD